MSNKWPTVRLAEVLKPVSRPTTPDVSRSYRLLGVRLDGNGAFHRETVTGSETSASQLFEVKDGDFIYSRLFAWRGAFGLIDSDLAGAYVSSEFPTFRANEQRLDPRFLNYWFRLPDTLRRVEADCTGSTPLTRNRFKETFFLNLEIALPSIGEQRRIVDLIEAIAGKVEEARRVRGEIDADALFDRIRSAWFEEAGRRFAKRPLGDLISMASGKGLTSSEMDDSAPYPVYGGGGCNGRYTRYLFEDAKIVIGRVGARCGCVFVTEPKAWVTDNALYLSKVSSDLSEAYLAHGLAALDLRRQANQAAQPVVSQKNINPILIPVPPLVEQRRIAANLDAVHAEVDELKRLQDAVTLELEMLLSAVLVEAFQGAR